MKKPALFFLIIFNLSCKSNEPAVTDDSTMSASLDGVAWTTATNLNISAVYDKSSTTFNLVGTSATTNLGFTLKKFSKATGTFALSDALSNNTGSYTDVKGTTVYTIQGGRTGTLTITKLDATTVEGTFSMTTYNSISKKEVKITAGIFKSPYKEI